MGKLNKIKIIFILIISVFLFSCNPHNQKKDETKECFCAEKQYIPQSILENHSNSNLFTIKCEYYNNGKIKKIDEAYFTEKHLDTLISNQHITFDTCGNMIEDKSHLLSLVAHSDTIRNGENYKLKIKLTASYFDSYIAAFIGKFNEKFILLDSNNIDSVFNDTTEVYYKTKKYTLGKNIIRGIARDYVSYYINNDTTHIVFKFFDTYFSKSFYVLP